MCYNVYMKEKQIHIRTDEKFLQKVEYLMRIYQYKSLSDTIRRIIEKEYRKESQTAEELLKWIPAQVMHQTTDFCGIEGVIMYNGALKSVWRHIKGDEDADW